MVLYVYNVCRGAGTAAMRYTGEEHGFMSKKRLVLNIVLIVLMLGVAGFVLKLCLDQIAPDSNWLESAISDLFKKEEETEEEPEHKKDEEVLQEEDPEPEPVASTATVIATGDLLMHMPVISGYQAADGSYQFDPMFRYVKDYSEPADFAVANLETTLAGSMYPYSGYPMFNCPDEIVDGAQNAGFDLLLTANNHSYDTFMDGYNRTQEVIRSKGLENLGTMTSAEDPKYVIKDLNGIQIGILCYTYETSDGTGSYPALNGIPMTGASYDVINCFAPTNPEPFYQELDGYLTEMEEAGAEATILFIHWGIEYQTYANDQQRAMAQRICDLGVDVIIGGHPHVVQPMELLSSTTDPKHKTVCLYSMGNAVSNQRLGNISYVSTAHTEDGVLFSVTFEETPDSGVYLSEVELIPTWVNRYAQANYQFAYDILPLDYERVDEWSTLYNIGENTMAAAKSSYDRTMAIVGEGLQACQDYLEQRESQ